MKKYLTIIEKISDLFLFILATIPLDLGIITSIFCPGWGVGGSSI